MEHMMPVERAIEVAAANNADSEAFGDGWRYEVEPRGIGLLAVIAVYDEDGERVGTL